MFQLGVNSSRGQVLIEGKRAIIQALLVFNEGTKGEKCGSQQGWWRLKWRETPEAVWRKPGDPPHSLSLSTGSEESFRGVEALPVFRILMTGAIENSRTEKRSCLEMVAES